MSDAGLKFGDTTLFLNAEALCPPIGDLNALLKRLAEGLLPLLGDQIRLDLFCASGVFPVVVQPSQFEDILSRFFLQAKEEMPTGGTVLLQTAQVTISEDSCLNSAVGTASNIVVTFKFTAFETKGDQARAAAGVQSHYKSARFEAAVQAAGKIVGESRGFLTLDCSHPDTVIRLYLPIADHSVLPMSLKPSEPTIPLRRAGHMS